MGSLATRGSLTTRSSITCKQDHLKIRNISELGKSVSPDETLLHSREAVRIDSKGKKKRSYLLLSSQAFYSLKPRFSVLGLFSSQSKRFKIKYRLELCYLRCIVAS